MTTSSGRFAELLWPGIAELWGDEYNQWVALYEKVFEMKTSDKRFEKFQGVTGLPLAAVKDEGSNALYVDPFQGFQKEFVNVTYALGTTVTREMYEDDMYNYINELPKFLARSMRQTEETIAWQHINNGFDGSFTGADGLSLFSASHVLVGSAATYSNQLATPADLSQTSVEQMCQDILDLVDDQSLKLRAEPVCLIVPTQVNFQAIKLLESYGIIGSANNDINPINGMFRDFVVSPYLTDPDAWFIKTNVTPGLCWLTRRAREINRDNEFDTQNLKFLTTERFSSGWVDPRSAFGTAGA